LFPEATVFFTPMVMGLSLVAIVYTSLVALVQTDMKKLIAYSSVAHMGFVTLGIFSLTTQGVSGAVLQMLSHGIVSAALFLCVGVVYDRMHTRDIAKFGGVVKLMPAYALVFMIFMLASVGLPGTSGFVGEFLVILGTYRVNTMVAVIACSGMVLGAAYMLYLYRRVIFGKMQLSDIKAMVDLSGRELLIMIPLVLVVIWMGVYPKTFLDIINPSVQNLVDAHQKSVFGQGFASEMIADFPLTVKGV
jgi:NADH-quinone oxidoreductase subunit M